MNITVSKIAVIDCGGGGTGKLEVEYQPTEKRFFLKACYLPEGKDDELLIALKDAFTQLKDVKP